jgi:hypothetical protein
LAFVLHASNLASISSRLIWRGFNIRSVSKDCTSISSLENVPYSSLVLLPAIHIVTISFSQNLSPLGKIVREAPVLYSRTNVF